MQVQATNLKQQQSFASSKKVYLGTRKQALQLGALNFRKNQVVCQANNKNENIFSKNFSKFALGLSALTLSLGQITPALAQDYQQSNQQQPQTSQVKEDQKFNVNFNSANTQNAPATKDIKLPEGNQWRYSEFLEAVYANKIERVRFSRDGSQLQLTAVDGRRAMVTLPNDPDLVDILAKNGVDISVSEGDQQGNFALLIGNLIFPILAFAALFFLLNQNKGQGGQQGGGMGGMGGPGGFGGMGNPMQQGKSKFSEVTDTGIKFDDVAGVEGAKLELREIVDFLKNAEKYTQLGAKVPKGALLVGPPGTGKTLLAKAVAGEAGVPFFSCAASEFVEMFVGVGASRVRDLFEKAKQKAPCIIFVDEIDAVGRARGAGMGMQNDEREQTINQLLTELDGFEGNSGVIVIAATNRPDVLDKALLRPGRFDRQISVERPDVAGRIAILKVHSKGKKLSSDFDFDKIARRTPGFTGADLQNLMNEAAILTARQGKVEVSNEEIAEAIDRIQAGPEKSGSIVNPSKKRLVAYHESGHAIVGALMPDYDPVTKISIVPRGGAGGITFFAPSEERLESQLYSRSYLENQMAVALGGRVAEELIFGPNDLTTGAQNDFQQVTRIARVMVTQLGFSSLLGQIAWSQQSGPSFMGQQAAQPSEYSMETASEIDLEVKKLVERAYRRAKDLMSTNMGVLHKMAETLLEKENLDGEELNQLILKSQANQYLKDDEPSVELPYQSSYQTLA